MEKVSGRQLSLIGAAYIVDATLISVPSQVIRESRMDSWLSYVFSAMVIVLPLWMLSRIVNRFPGKDLFAILAERFPFSGRVISFGYILCFFFILCRDIRMVTDFINLLLLPKTPIVFIGIVIAFTVLLIARGGVEILARMTELWFPVLTLVIILLGFAMFKDFEYKFLKPFFEFGLAPPIRGAWIASSYVGEVMAVYLLFNHSEMKLSYALKGLGLGVCLLIAINFYTILSLGIHIPTRVLYPTYEMVRQVHITDFLDRFDLPLVGIWLPTMLAKIAFSLYVVCHGLKSIVPGISAKVICAPLGIASFVCSLWFFQNTIQLFNFNRAWPVIALTFEIVIPICLFFILKPAGMRASSS